MKFISFLCVLMCSAHFASAAEKIPVSPNPIDSRTFFEELNSYIEKTNAPAIELKRLAATGDLLSRARYCATGVIDDYNIGVVPEDAIKTCQKLSEENIPLGIYLYARALKEGNGTERDLSEAVRLFTKAAEAGNVDAMYYVGRSYFYPDEGVTRDDDKAIEWYRKAMANGSTQAICGLSHAYKIGQGVPKDNDEAIKLSWTAVEKEEACGMQQIGSAFMLGTSFKKDMSEALKWLKKAAAKGAPGAMLIIGNLYFGGNGVSKDTTEAVNWWTRGAAKGNSQSMFMLGLHYNKKVAGVDRNIKEAEKWFKLAAKKGHKRAKEELERLNQPRSAIPYSAGEPQFR